ncbi:MAG: adenine phosphoribosyltransferase [Candidatus Omnitrophica bacterium]|nr:adenine phosphoribosyltransferase [Candidatus Omnitrophota bacterium]
MKDLKKYIRDIPGFPKPGIIFKDITTLLKEGKAFKESIDMLASELEGKKAQVVLSVESRGFIFGAALAYKLGLGIVPIRKPGKLPHEKHTITYDLEYGKDALEMHKDAFKKGDKVLIVDDLLATGGTTRAVIDLVEKMGGEIAGIAFLIELLPLKGREKLKGYPVYSIIKDEYC